MADYQVMGEYRGVAMRTLATESAAEALAHFDEGVKPGGLPPSAVRITVDGIEIDRGELQRRLEAEQNA